MRFFGFLLMFILGCNVSAYTQEWLTRTYRLRAPQDYWHPDTLLFEQDRTRWEIPATLPQRGLFDGTNLQRSGSLVRGISFAGNSDATSLSEFNLSLSGDIGNGLFLDAQISDKSMPITPEGTTATLQDFDRIFIRLMHKKFALQAGDVQVLHQSDGSFLQFQRNILGMSLDVAHNRYAGQHAFGVAKGKFVRRTLGVQAGIQGPYRLQEGEQTEQMQVISGSEKIYFNGELLRRGEDADYILNYSLAQIQFTSKRPISANDRVELEFEYTERTYARYLFSSHNTWMLNDPGTSGAKTSIFLNVFSEHDNAASALSGSLSEQAQRQLEQAGDDPSALWVVSYDSLAYSPSELLYVYVDTVVNSTSYHIFLRSIDPSKGHYRPKFSFMGSGKGNYKQLNIGSNGRSYVWVAPVGGVLQGDYDALIPLVPPMQKQIIETGITWAKDSSLRTEAALALSNYDGNTLSSSANRKAVGWAGRWKLEGLQKTANWKWNYTFGYWGQQASFEAADQYLPPEYALERSLPEGIQNIELQSINAGSSLVGKELKLQLNAEIYQFSHNSQGALIQWNASWHPVRWFLGSSGSAGNGYTNYRMWVIRKARLMHYGVRGQYERITRVSFVERRTQRVETFVSSPLFGTKQQAPLAWQVSWAQTDESYGVSEKRRQDIQAQMNWKQYPECELDFLLNYRRLEDADSITGNRNQLLMNGRLSSRMLKGMITNQVAWGLTNGYEARTEYYFVFVGATKGTHAWKDYNGDGVQQLAEFEISQFSDEAEYIKIFAPTRHYVPVSMQNIVWGFGIYPATVLSKTAGWQSVLACFSAQMNVMLDRKLQSAMGLNKWLDISHYAMSDTALVSLNKQWSTQLLFQSPKLIWTAELGYRKQSQKYALSDGAEWGGKSSWNAQLAQRFLTQFKWKTGWIQSEKTTVSQIYTQKNYQLREWNPYGGLEYHWKNSIRGEINYTFKHKTANALAYVRADVHRVELKPAYYFPDEGMLQTSLAYVYVDYPYAPGSVLAYEMLEGLLAGKNIQWEARFSRKVWGGIDAELFYNGRRLSSGKVLHAGTVSLRMNF